MIGVKYWNDSNRYHIQDNNETEAVIRKKGNPSHFLETCGPTSAINCLDAMGLLPGITMPGGYQPQAEDILTVYFNDPLNDLALRKTRPDLDPDQYMNNEVPQDYTVAVQAVFGKPCIFSDSVSHSGIMAALTAGKAVQICLINPGHFLAVVAFDEVTGQLCINDPWPERWTDGKGGFNRMIDFDSNIAPWCIIYG